MALSKLWDCYVAFTVEFYFERRDATNVIVMLRETMYLF